MRDEKVRFMRLTPRELDAGGAQDGRHVFSTSERRKGFRVFVENCILGKIPSRVAASVRGRIRGHFMGKADKRSA
jgi:hypothetical protein